MKRRPNKRYPKQVRRAVARLSAAGCVGILVEEARGYLLSWTSGAARMRVSARKSARGAAFEGLWAAIRALFRLRRLPVPA